MPKKKVAWTVMVYLAGDNNLSEECVYGLVEMKKANCDRKLINIVAQFDSSDEFMPTRRYEINRVDGGQLSDDVIFQAEFNRKTKEVHFGKESKRANALARERKRKKLLNFRLAKSAQTKGPNINEPPAPDPTRGGIDDTDTASRIQLYNFMSFCIQEYPADHYMVVLSGHGAGTERDYFLKDEGSSGYLTFNELKLAFEQLRKHDLDGQKMDIIGLDSCLMSMAEVSYELRDFAKITVGCESYAPAAGWPYRSILESLNGLLQNEAGGEPKAAATRYDVAGQLARAIVDNYAAFYADYTEGGLSVTQSALNLDQLPVLKDKITTLVDTLTAELETEAARENTKEYLERAAPFRDALLLAHWEAQSYNGESYVDIADFCECLAARYQRGKVPEVCRDLVGFITGEFVLRSCFNGSVYQYSNGVSIYFPWSTVALYYLNLDFAIDTGWAKFLATYVDLTRRAPRRPPISKTASQSDFQRLVEQNARISRDLFDLAAGEFATGESASAKVTSGSVASSRMDPGKMVSARMSSANMNPGKMGSGKMGSGKMGSGKMGSGKMGSGKMGSGKMGSGKMGSGKMGSGKMGSGKMGSGKMGSGKEGNPIHSMRNPPIEVASVHKPND